MTKQEETQSLGDKAYEVFIQSYYIDEILWQVVTEQYSNLRHLEWRHNIELRTKYSSPSLYKKFVGREGYQLVYDPLTKDSLTNAARNARQEYLKLIDWCARKRACKDEYGIRLKTAGLGVPILTASCSIEMAKELLKER